MKPLTIHVNTRDDRGRKRPLDRRTAIAVAHLMRAAYEQVSATMRRGKGVMPKLSVAAHKRISKRLNARRAAKRRPVKMNRTVIYPSKKGWSWRSKTKNGKKVSIGGESYVRYRRCVGAAAKWGPRGFPLFKQQAGKLIPIPKAFARSAAYEMD